MGLYQLLQLSLYNDIKRKGFFDSVVVPIFFFMVLGKFGDTPKDDD